MPGSLRRLTIHPAGSIGIGGAEAVDVTLPADHPVTALIPPIVDAVLNAPASADAPLGWFLTRLGGDQLDTSMTLRQNNIHDGESILLTASPVRPPRRRPGDSSAVVADQVANAAAPAALPDAVTAAAVTATIIGAAVLTGTGAVTGTTTQLWTAAALSAAAVVAAVLAGSTAQRISAVLAVTSVAFAVAAGFLAVADAAWAYGLLLGASSGFAVTILLWHLASAGTAVLSTLAGLTGAAVLTAAIGVSVDLPFGAAGAVLTALALVALALASKLTVALAGLGPARPSIGDRRARFGRRVLAGLVTGWSAAAALGVAAVAAGALSGSVLPIAAALFAADVGLLLLLRTRTHVSLDGRIALFAGGFGAWAASGTVAVSAAPEYSSWWCAPVVAAALIAVGRPAGPGSPNPLVRHVFQIIENLALAGVFPLAAWVGDLYGLVRELSLR